ncbi:zinc-ribbon domain-containing protein [Selenomonas ruminantium]|uniref:Probable Zinc-ribbon domain-containing protein n=1 Tax=Selenomonas ruminantium TaxID=971 RepID=A0A1H4A6N8_SELRU|nr:zinc-ribbon domain-containing protein [Selenomonas ruminantium]SEA31669.1 Probable Zinc-ribbon domain-containing protein [Selenomonas ruminantium]
MPVRYSLSDMRNLAMSHNGECLSNEYYGTTKEMVWRCEKGHVFTKKPKNIIHDGWHCPDCERENYMKKLQEIAAQHGGVCLSEQYISMKNKLAWKCSEGHTWNASPANILKGTWCPKCAGKFCDIDDMSDLARKKGGECLSNKYISNQIPLKWKCNQGHIFEATPASIKAGTWCPDCSLYKSERLCRIILEKFLGIKLSKKRPPWLLGVDGHRLEYDGYNEENKIAFEYQGKQHYENIFGVSDEKYARQMRNDAIKKKLSQQKGITLVIVPYFEDTSTMEARIEHVRNILIKNNIVIKNPNIIVSESDFLNRPLRAEVELIVKEKGGILLTKTMVDNGSRIKLRCDHGHEWTTTVSLIKSGAWCYKCGRKSCGDKNRRLTLDDAIKVAEKNGGKCLSTEYISAVRKLTWQCGACGHIWKATLSSIRSSHTWCPKCNGNNEYTIEDMQKLAHQHDGYCLSTHYVSAKEKLKWRCKHGHEWEATPDSIRRGSWCSKCRRGEGMSLEKLKKIAVEHGGECLETEYHGRSQRIKCKCKEGHVWETSVASLQAGHWCSECMGKPKIDIEYVRRIASEHGGMLLSNTYVNAHTKMTWICKEGHRFESNYNRIQSGGWCPKCAKIQQGIRQRKHTISEMQEIAKNKGGKCLSQEYISIHKPLEWECVDGHTWNSSYGNIRQGKWCPVCAKKRRYK